MSANCSGRRGQVWGDFSADGVKSSVCHSGRAEKEEKSPFEALIDLCVCLNIDQAHRPPKRKSSPP